MKTFLFAMCKMKNLGQITLKGNQLEFSVDQFTKVTNTQKLFQFFEDFSKENNFNTQIIIRFYHDQY